MTAKKINEKILGKGDWIYLREISYLDDHGKNRTWESADRFNQRGAVGMLAHFIREDEYLFVEQFRPPLNQYVIEFPAGMIDGDETIESAALRELFEETGYTGTIRLVVPPSFSSPGLSGEAITIVAIDIDTQESRNQQVKSHPDEGEFITVHRIPRLKIASFIQEQRQFNKAIDSKIIAFFLPDLISQANEKKI